MRFGALAPDLPPRLNDDTLRVADGVYATPQGYRPVGQYTQIFTPLASEPKGGASFTNPQGISSVIAGTATNLYRAYSGGWQSISAGYSIQGDQRWRFAQFGGLAIATNAADVMKKIDLATMTVSDLGGAPPKFEFLFVVKDVLVGTVMNGDVATLAWCGINDAEWWTFGQRGSDFNIMPSGGRINGGFSGEQGVILQRNRICTMDFVGGNIVFEINEHSSNIGCVTPHSVAQWGSLGFFYSDDGFMKWDGQQAIPIGQEVIDRTFAAQYSEKDWSKMSTAVDPKNDRVVWSMGDKQWAYNWVLNRWTTATVATPVIFSGVTKGFSIDEDYPPDMPDDANIDGAGLVSLDSPIFKGGDPIFYVFGADYGLGSLSGPSMTATFAGNDIELYRGRTANIRFVRPETDATAGLSLALLQKQRLGDAGSNGVFASINTSGDMPVRARGRYIRPILTITAGTAWTFADGLEFQGEKGAVV
jgi:hypothetical protein